MINVVPTNDWIDHILSPECIYEPNIEMGDNGELFVIHNAIDLRELAEQSWAVIRE